MERTIWTEYLGTPLKLVHFDRSGYFGRSNWNVPFIWQDYCPQYLRTALFCILLARTICKRVHLFKNRRLLFAVWIFCKPINNAYDRLRVVPHFSSGIVERAKRERAWKLPHARKGDTRRGERIFSLSLSRVAFFRVGWFSRPLRKNGGLLVVYAYDSKNDLYSPPTHTPTHTPVTDTQSL